MTKEEKLKICKFYKGDPDVDPFDLFPAASLEASTIEEAKKARDAANKISAFIGEMWWVEHGVSDDDLVSLLADCPHKVDSIGLPRSLVACLFGRYCTSINKGSFEPVPQSVVWNRFFSEFLPVYNASSRMM